MAQGPRFQQGLDLTGLEPYLTRGKSTRLKTLLLATKIITTVKHYTTQALGFKKV